MPPKILTEYPVFNGFTPKTFAWFGGLEKENTKTYFEANRAIWEAHVRDPLTGFLAELHDDFPGTVKVYRPNRDVRFSPDKSPYKTTNYGVIMGEGGAYSGYYAQVSAQGLYVATGVYDMAKDQLARYRAAAGDEKTGKVLEKLVADIRTAGILVEGEALAGVPRGYPKDHPRARLLAMKELLIGGKLTAKEAVGSDGPLALARTTWKAAAKLNRWLLDHVGPSELMIDKR